MRRLQPALVVIGVAATTCAIPASAGTGSVTVRSDPNDSTSVLDIRKVGTDQTQRLVFTGIRAWDPFSMNDVTFQDDSFWVFLLDTKNRGKADKLLYLGYDNNSGRFECDLFNRDGGFKGERPASQSNDQITCVTPRKWYDIEKTPKFGVEAYENGGFTDRAPNNGRYVGL